MSHHLYTVVIVGAGPGGLSVAAALLEAGFHPEDIVVVDRGEVGQAWLDYPADTHLLSESSPAKDDNEIAGVRTSDVFPNIPHPSHLMYQKYLDYVAQVKKIPVKKNTTVESVVFNPEHKEFALNLRGDGYLTSKYVVWAAGMYYTPNENLDMEGCYIHYAKLPYLDDIDAKEITVVGSANGASGVVMQLARPGRKVTLVVSREYQIPMPIDCLWKENMKFVQDMEREGLVDIVEHFRVKRIYKEEERYYLESEDGKKLSSPEKPIICTGFLLNIEPVASLVDEVVEDREHHVDIDPDHQSKKQPGLYFAGVIGRFPGDTGFIISFREFGEPIAQSILEHEKER